MTQRRRCPTTDTGTSTELEITDDNPRPPGKSYKRELAVVILCFWLAILVKLFFLVAPETIKAYETLFIGITWPMLGIVAAAFGLDFVMKSKTPVVPPRTRPPGGR